MVIGYSMTLCNTSTYCCGALVTSRVHTEFIWILNFNSILCSLIVLAHCLRDIPRYVNQHKTWHHRRYEKEKLDGLVLDIYLQALFSQRNEIVQHHVVRMEFGVFLAAGHKLTNTPSHFVPYIPHIESNENAHNINSATHWHAYIYVYTLYMYI